MFTLMKWTRLLLTVLALAVFAATAAAAPRSAGSVWATDSGESLPAPAAEPPPAGSPELGVLIIIGVIGFLVLVAWLFTRVGEDNRSGGDRTLL